MRRSCRHDWRLELGVWLALLGVVGFAPQVRAGCEALRVVTGSNTETSHQAAVDPLSNAAPVLFTPHSMPVPRPCSGPHCSRAPLVPPASPVTTMAPSQEWACFAVASNDVYLPGTAYRLEDDPHKPIFRTFGVYHPPR